MNWVGGFRDKVRRTNKTQQKQQEYFERKQHENYMRHGSKYALKRGVSRDLLNLDCISKTVRNPFDEQVECKGELEKQEAISLSDAEVRDSFKKRLKKHVASTQLSKKNFPVCHSTPLPMTTHSINYVSEPMKVVGSTQSVSHPFSERSVPHPSKKFKRLSPIYAAESCQSTSLNPLSIETDEELLLHNTSFLSADSYSLEPESTIEQTSLVKCSSAASQTEKYMEFFHGNALNLNKLHNSLPTNQSAMPMEDHFKQYDLKNQLDFHDSIHLKQQAYMSSCLEENDNAMMPLKVSKNCASFTTCDSDISPHADSTGLEDEEIFSHHTLSPLWKSDVNVDTVLCSGYDLSSSSSMSATALHRIKQDNASPSPEQLLPHSMVNSRCDTLRQVKFYDKFQQTEINEEVTQARRKETYTIDASTSPIVLSGIDIGVQVCYKDFV